MTLVDPAPRAGSEQSTQQAAAAVARKTGGTFRANRNRSLDGIRAVAIALVFAEHFGGFAPGTVGVDVFFVLSGYLITGLLVAEFDRRGTLSFRSFYGRRALRLMPAYLTMIVATVAVALALAGEQTKSLLREGVTWSLTYSSNIATAAGRWDNEHPRLWEFTWSLAAEEQFYLVWPLLLLIALRWARGRDLRAALGMIPFAGFLLSVGWSWHLIGDNAPLMRVAVAPDTRSGALLLGCAVALWQRGTSRWLALAARWSGIGLGAWVMVVFGRHDPYAQATYSPLIAVATALLIAGLTGRCARPTIPGALLGLRPMAFIGRLSYSLYLYNVLAILLFTEVHRRGLISVQPDARPFVAAAFALGLAWLSYVCVELPFLRLRDRRRTPHRPVREPQSSGRSHYADQALAGSDCQ